MELTLSEVKPIIKYIVKNNDNLTEQGKARVAVNLCSEAGIGKSTIVEDIAKELDANYVKLALAQITETGDIAGYPILLHYACMEDGSDCKWIAPELINSYVKAGYKLTGETKMSYALPEWYKNIDLSKKTILLLDDFSRSLPNIMQACYELIYKQEFWSFKLPEGTTVILTTNPDSGDYNVNSYDEAGKTRMISFNIKFDIDSWASWAENNDLDGRAINFMLNYYSELMDDHGTHTHIMNARSYTMFANIISGLNDWQSPDTLAMILQIASGCFNDKDNIVGSLFTTFIANKLDKLIAPKDMLLEKWETVHPKIKSCVYDSAGNYRPAVAAILQTRLLNYCIKYFDQKGSKTDVVCDRLLEIINAPKMLFDEDIMFNIIRVLCTNYKQRTNKWMLNTQIRQRIIS